jgi:hypothetical protein
VFDCRFGGNQAGVQGNARGVLNDALGFLDHAVNRIAFDARVLFPDRANTLSSMTIFCLVSAKWVSTSALKSALPAAFAKFGNAFVSAVSA